MRETERTSLLLCVVSMCMLMIMMRKKKLKKEKNCGTKFGRSQEKRKNLLLWMS